MTLEWKSALVTGGAGFIGSHLVDELVAGGCRVTVLDNLTTGNPDNIRPVRDRVTFIEGDIRDRSAVAEAVSGCDVVFHQAAVVSVAQSIEDPVGSAMVNDLGTLHVLEAATQGGVGRVVLASSAAVYGDDPEVPKTEVSPLKPKSPYAVQKRADELYAGVYWELYGLETVCLRYFNVFGPRQDPSSPYSGVISIFMNRCVAGQPPVIFGDGGQYRDFVYVKDVVRANLLAAGAENVGGQWYNVGTGRHVSINRLWEMIAGLAGVDLDPVYRPARAGDIVRSVSSIDQAARVLGYAPETDLEQGLDRTLAWYRGQGPAGDA